MIFSRKATSEDFDKALEKYVLHLSHEVRELIKNGESKQAKRQVVREMGISFRKQKW